MLLRMAAELAATGALVMRWFQALSEGNSCWPSSVGTVRSSSSSTVSRVRRWGCFLFFEPNKRRSNVHIMICLLNRKGDLKVHPPPSECKANRDGASKSRDGLRKGLDRK